MKQKVDLLNELETGTKTKFSQMKPTEPLTPNEKIVFDMISGKLNLD